MNAQVKESGEPTGSPRLGLLQLEMRVNTTDKKLLENLKYAKSLNLPKIRLAEANDKVLYICGSGTSLKLSSLLIPNGSDILALNGAYRYLRSLAITPKYFAMLDSRECNTNFFEDLSTETTYLLASQCHHSSFAEILDFPKRGVFHLATPTTQKIFPNEELYVGGAGTIGLTSLGIAIALGYRRVYLLGFDSSVGHVLPQSQNEDDELIDVWVQDRKYMATKAMAAQTMDFFPFYDAIRECCPEFQITLMGSGLFYDYIMTNNHESTRERELSKYAMAYKEEDYGMSKERYDGISQLLADIPRSHRYRYLDVSTGRGETMQLAHEHGFKDVWGTETVDELIKDHMIKGILPNLEFSDKSFDVVSLFEVIEHLVPEDVPLALGELTRLAIHHILISAAVYDCYIGGVNLHPSARSVEKWQELFEKVWGSKVRRVGNLGSSPVWRVDL